MPACCGNMSQGSAVGVGTSDASMMGGLFASGSSCGLCMKCLFFWILLGILALLLLRGRRD